jgi:hypothetical protein
MPAQSSYSVELKKSGKTLFVEPGLSLLDVLLEAGREIDHRDGVLTKAERAANRSMMVCVSGCKGRAWCWTSSALCNCYVTVT